MTSTPKTRFLAGILWSVFSRWTAKGLGMINIIILARLLSPEDFGIVAMASIVINMLDSATQTGVHLYFFRSKDDNPRLLHSVWTLTFIQSASIALIMVLIAPWVAVFYEQQVLIDVLYCLALAKLLSSFNSIGMIIAQKQLNFKLDFNFTFAVRLAYLFATVAFAYWLQNFWAIIFGKLFSAAFGMVLGYVMHPYRPKFDFYQWRDLLQFSKSTIPLSMGRFINNQADVVVMGKVASADYLGKYHMASNLAAMFTKELLIPVIRGLIPNLAALQNNPGYNKTLSQIIASAVYVFLPIGMGLAATAPELVAVLLGQQWADTAPMLAWLSLYCTVGGILMFVSEQFLVLMHKEQLSNRLMWMRNAILLLTIAVTLWQLSFVQLPQMLFLSTLLTLPLTVVFVARALELPLWQLLMHWWPAIMAACLMLFAIKFLPWPQLPVYILLVVKVLFGALSYAISVMLIYYLRGKPDDSVEGLILGKLKARR